MLVLWTLEFEMDTRSDWMVLVVPVGDPRYSALFTEVRLDKFDGVLKSRVSFREGKVIV